MSQTIDSKVVEMRFDNKQFESKVQSSIKSIDKLEDSLNFSGATKGLENINASVKGLDFSGIADGVSTIGQKFSALETIAVGALLRIGAQLADTGEKLIKNLSVDNISAGWEKFGDKTTSVATLVSQGYSLDEVNKQLDRLNWFTDETSYNFTDMVSNIAKFTAAGKDLNTSVDAMEGIANWAALSGQNASTASHAMYQISQAMGAGIMRKEDYKSIQNASMDTDEFRQKALDAAVALGTLKKNVDGTYTSLVNDSGAFSKSQFADHLTEDAWFTSDVMMKVFNDYSGAVDQIYSYADKKGITASEAIEELGDNVDQFGLKAFKAAQEARTWGDVIDSVKDAVSTGWMNTFELIFGNYEEAKKLWTDLANELYDVFAESGNVRNAMLQVWKDQGGRDAFINSLWNTFHAITDMAAVVKDAFHDIFPPMTSKRLLAITKSIEDLTKKFKMSEETTEKLRRTFRGLFAVVDILKQFLIGIIAGVKQLLSPLDSLNVNVLDITASIGDWLVKLDEILKKNNTFKNGIVNIVKVLQSIPSKINEIFTKITGKSVGEAFTLIKNVITDSVKSINDSVGGLDGAISKIKAIPSVINDAFAKITGKKLTDVFKTIISSATEALKSVKKVFEGFKKVDTSGLDDISKTTAKKLSPLEKVFDKLKAIFDAISKVFKKVFGVIKKIGSKIASVFKEIFGELSNSFGDVGLDDALDLANGGALLMIALGIKNFVDSLSNIGKDAGSVFTRINDLIGNVSGTVSKITDILDGVKGSLEAYQNNLKAKTLLTIAGAVAVLTASLVVLSSIDPQKLSSALTTVTIELTQLFVSLSAMTNIIDGKKLHNMTKAASTLILMSTAVLILSIAVKKLSSMKADEAIVGVGSTIALLGALIIVADTLSKSSGKMMKGATGLIAMSIAVRLLIKPIKELGNLDRGTLIQGLISLAAILAELTITTKLMGNSKKIIATSVALTILSMAIRLLIKPIKELGNMDEGALIQGLWALAITLAELGLFVNAVGGSKKMISIATGVTILGAAMLIFVKAVSQLGDMDEGSLIQGLLGMASALTIIAVAVKAMPASVVLIAPALVVVAVALKVLASSLNDMGNMSTEQIAKSLITLGIALGELAIGLNLMKGTLGGASALFTASVALTVLSVALNKIGKMSAGKIVKSIVTIAAALGVMVVAGYAAGPIAPALIALGGAIALIGAGCLAAGLGVLAFSTGLAELAVTGPAGIAILLSAFEQWILTIPKFAKSLGEAVVVLVKVILDALPPILENVGTILKQILSMVSEFAPQIIDTILSIVDGLLSSLAEHMPSLASSIVSILLTILHTIDDNIEEIAATGASIVVGLLEGIARKLPDIIQAAFDVLLAFITGLGQAIKDNAKALRAAINTLVTDILDAICEFLGIHSPSTKFKEIAGNMIDGLIEGFKDFVGGAVKAVKDFMGKLIEKIGDFFSKFKKKGGEIITKIKDGFVDKFMTIRDKMSQIISGIVNVVGGAASKFFTKGKDIIKSIIKGIKNVASDLWDSFTDIIDDAVEAVEDFIDDFTEIGGYLIDGLIEGIKSGATSVKEKVEDIGQSIKDGICDFFGIESPSKVMAEIGRYIDEGLIVGIEDMSNDVTKSATNMGEDAIDGIATATSRIADIINSDPNFNPVITPVVDLSNVVAGSNSINDMFSADRTLALAGNATMQMNGKLSAGFNNNKITVDNRDVVDEIRSLRGEMNTMSESIQKMKIVMDTNALVGAIAGPMDRNLGRRVVYKARGV